MKAPWVTEAKEDAPEHHFTVGRKFRLKGRTCEIVAVTEKMVTVEFYEDGNVHEMEVLGKDLHEALR